MGYADKVQFSARASVAGMTMTIESRANENQTILSTPIKYDDGPFYLFNVLCRQRFMRFTWNNTTGVEVTDVSMELKESYGSSDKLSVFPVNVDPSDFSQAALVQAITRGQTPNGEYVNQQINEAGATLVSSFGTEVARGLYNGYVIKNHFGHNADIDTGSTPEDIIHGGGIYTGFDAIANENVEALSDSNSDSGALVSSGTATGGSATTLIDTGATFVTDTVAVGDVILNDTQGYHGFVTSVDSETQLTVYRMNDGAGFIHVNSSGDVYRVAESTSTGAAVVKLENILNANEEEQTPIYVIMNGSTGVTTTGDVFRCSRARVIHSGSNDVNEGEITVRQATTTANVFALIDITGRSEMALDTVPKGKTAVLKDIRASIVRANGSPGSGHIILFAREKGGSWNAREVFGIQTGANVDQKFEGGVVLESGTDFKLTVQDVSDNNTEADGSLEYYFIDEEALS